MASKKRISMAESEMMSLGSEETTPLDNTLMGNIEALQNSFFGVTKTENDGIKEIAVSLHDVDFVRILPPKGTHIPCTVPKMYAIIVFSNQRTYRIDSFGTAVRIGNNHKLFHCPSISVHNFFNACNARYL